jgi:hypothetical protein
MSRSVLEASQPGNTQHDRTLAKEQKDREARHNEEKELNNAKYYTSNPASTYTSNPASTYTSNPASTYTSNSGRTERVKSGDRKAEAEAEEELKKLRGLKLNNTTQEPKCEGSYCTISGGKRRKSRKQRGNRKSRKQRGSRKSKKSRRR